MPDLLLVFSNRWKLVTAITLCATVLALIIAMLSPKKYLSTATALPVNSVTADKARIFNSNIEALYSDFGTPDELDRLEGTARLDTIFIAASEKFNLGEHYSYGSSNEGIYLGAVKLKKNSKIARSSYGELKVKVWDVDRIMAAEMANFLMQSIQELHQHLQNQSNVVVLQKIKEQYATKQAEYLQLADSLGRQTGNGLVAASSELFKTRVIALGQQVQEYEKMIGEYQLATTANAPVLLVVETARPALWPDEPKVLVITLLVFFAAFIFSFVLALSIESRKRSV
ncbi:MAG: hypothetical protein ACXVBH_05330 [Flavisolibacter sp.]